MLCRGYSALYTIPITRAILEMYWAGTPNCPSMVGSAITAAASAARILIIIVDNFPLSIKIYSS